MKFPNDRVVYLLKAYTDGIATPEEKRELYQWVVTVENTDILKDYMMKLWDEGEFDSAPFSINWDSMFEQALRAAKGQEAKVVRPFFWKQVAAAAAIIILVASGGYFLLQSKKEKPVELVKTIVPNDIKAPTGSKATITLKNGQMVYLDSIGAGTVAAQANVKLVKLSNGEIAYQSETGKMSREMIYNTLNNPQGSKVAVMTLEDGSKVWLNAGSSLTYPVAFIGTERKVEISGEAYFEVAHNSAKPFTVSVNNGMQIQVLGTQFNVNAYDDEPTIKTTLLEGSVKVIRDNAVTMLLPGQQAALNKNGQFNLNKHADTEEAVAWKNGKFSFNETDVETLMRQISRWYDVEVVYEGEIPKGHYNGNPSRNLSAANMLKLIDYSGLKIKIEGKRIIVSK
jgi:transmembrane sensor